MDQNYYLTGMINGMDYKIARLINMQAVPPVLMIDRSGKTLSKKPPLKLTLKEIQEVETEMVREISRICKEHKIPYFLHCGSALGAVRHHGPIPWDSDVDVIVPYHRCRDFCDAMRRNLPEKFCLYFHDTDPHYVALFPRIGLAGYSSKIMHVDVFRLIGISSIKWKQNLFTGLTSLLKKMSYFKKVKTDSSFSKFRFFYYVMIKIMLIPVSCKWIVILFDRLCRMYPYEESIYVTNPSGHYGRKNIQPREVYGKGTETMYEGFRVVIPEQYDKYLKHYYGDYLKLPLDKERNTNRMFDILPV